MSVQPSSGYAELKKERRKVDDEAQAAMNAIIEDGCVHLIRFAYHTKSL